MFINVRYLSYDKMFVDYGLYNHSRECDLTQIQTSNLPVRRLEDLPRDNEPLILQEENELCIVKFIFRY